MRVRFVLNMYALNDGILSLRSRAVSKLANSLENLRRQFWRVVVSDFGTVVAKEESEQEG